MGRPSKKTPAICAEICRRLAQGEPLAVLCRDAHMPDPSTVWDWTEADEEFSQAIARARAHGHAAILDECKLIADTPVEGQRVEIDAEGKQKIIKEDMLGHRKLQIETRLKLLAKWDPRRYGDRQQVDHNVTESLEELLRAGQQRDDGG